MIILRQKQYAATAKDILLKGVTPISVAGLGLSVYNTVSNRKKRKKDREFQEKQLEYYDRLTKALNKNTKAHEKEKDD